MRIIKIMMCILTFILIIETQKVNGFIGGEDQEHSDPQSLTSSFSDEEPPRKKQKRERTVTTLRDSSKFRLRRLIINYCDVHEITSDNRNIFLDHLDSLHIIFPSPQNLERFIGKLSQHNFNTVQSIFYGCEIYRELLLKYGEMERLDFLTDILEGRLRLDLLEALTGTKFYNILWRHKDHVKILNVFRIAPKDTDVALVNAFSSLPDVALRSLYINEETEQENVGVSEDNVGYLIKMIRAARTAKYTSKEIMFLISHELRPNPLFPSFFPTMAEIFQNKVKPRDIDNFKRFYHSVFGIQYRRSLDFYSVKIASAGSKLLRAFMANPLPMSPRIHIRSMMEFYSTLCDYGYESNDVRNLVRFFRRHEKLVNLLYCESVAVANGVMQYIATHRHHLEHFNTYYERLSLFFQSFVIQDLEPYGQPKIADFIGSLMCLYEKNRVQQILKLLETIRCYVSDYHSDYSPILKADLFYIFSFKSLWVADREDVEPPNQSKFHPSILCFNPELAKTLTNTRMEIESRVEHLRYIFPETPEYHYRRIAIQTLIHEIDSTKLSEIATLGITSRGTLYEKMNLVKQMRLYKLSRQNPSEIIDFFRGVIDTHVLIPIAVLNTLLEMGATRDEIRLLANSQFIDLARPETVDILEAIKNNGSEFLPDPENMDTELHPIELFENDLLRYSLLLFPMGLTSDEIIMIIATLANYFSPENSLESMFTDFPNNLKDADSIVQFIHDWHNDVDIRDRF